MEQYTVFQRACINNPAFAKMLLKDPRVEVSAKCVCIFL